MPTAGTFTPEKREKLRAAYDKAIADAEESFWFGCDEYVVEYAEHLLEYLDKELGE